MNKIKQLLVASLTLIGLTVTGQQVDAQGPYEVTKAASVTIMPSIASRSQLLPSTEKFGEVEDGRASKNTIIPGKGTSEDDILAANQHRLANTIQGREAELVFETALSSSQPTDPSGAVGPNHYFAVFNTGFRIFDKEGNALTGQLGTGNIFPASGCCDLTVSYDNLADRWVVSFLGNGVQVAVSTGPDPVTTGWVVYNFPSIADYNKLSVWRDGYYITQNGGSSRVHVLERDAALEGDEDAQMASFLLPGIATSGFNSAQAFNITDANHPQEGPAAVVYLQDDAWAGVSEDHIKLWEIDLDWENVSNSTVSAPQEIPTTPFISVFDGGSFANLTQPNGGQDIDALQATIMNQAQFRRFDDHNSAVFNFVVDTDATASELAGIRWIEFRQPSDGGTWSLYQEGTFTAPEGRHAWHGSMAMDTQGNIGLGFTAMAGPTTDTTADNRFVSSYYTGRFAEDPLGTMTIEPTLIAAGTANIPGSERYGDYGKMDVDPLGGRKFWFLNEYRGSNGRANVLGVFQIAAVLPNDIGVITIDAPAVSGSTLDEDEDITITIFNYGENSASNFEVTYQIDGGTVVTETFTGTIDSEESAQFTFETGGDFSEPGGTFTIVASTNLTGDEDNSNDSVTQQVTSLSGTDVGVIALISPSAGNQSSDEEPIVVVIENFGGQDQTSFDVSYSINGGTLITETVDDTVIAGETLEYTFNETADLGDFQEYEIFVTTSLDGDTNEDNDGFTTTFINLSCMTQVNDNNMPIGPNANTVTESVITFDEDLTIIDVNVTIDVVHTFDADLEIELIAPDGTVVELVSDAGGSGDNFTGTTFDDDAATIITSGSAPFSGTFRPEGSLADFNGLSTNGEWTLRITDDENGDAGTLLSWTLQLCSDPELSLQDDVIAGTELIIIHKGGNQFDVNLNSEVFTDALNLRVFNMAGQKLLDTKVYKEGNSYNYNLDMSYVSKGVYLIQVGNSSARKVERLIVR